jgi:CBS domain-containing protein
VMDEGKLIGIISIGDLVKNIIRTYLKIERASRSAIRGG